MIAAALLALLLQDAPFKHENTTDNLKQFFEKLQKASAAGDEKTALALTNGVLPDEAALRKGLKDATPAETVGRCAEFWKKLLPPEDAKRAKVFVANPANTEIRVTAATTEELLKYEKGSVAFVHFPAGAKQLAETVLRPGMTWYEVLLAKPGADSGVKYHLFYWTGERWSCLGPLWRAVQ